MEGFHGFLQLVIVTKSEIQLWPFPPPNLHIFQFSGIYTCCKYIIAVYSWLVNIMLEKTVEQFWLLLNPEGQRSRGRLPQSKGTKRLHLPHVNPNQFILICACFWAGAETRDTFWVFWLRKKERYRNTTISITCLGQIIPILAYVWRKSHLLFSPWSYIALN